MLSMSTDRENRGAFVFTSSWSRTQRKDGLPQSR